MTTIRRDTGRAKLPALPPVNAQETSLRNWMTAVAERLEVREGSRGNPMERALTLRDLPEATGGLVQIVNNRDLDPSQWRSSLDIGNGFSASVNIDRFVQSILNSRLYNDLAKSLNDPTRFNHLANEIREVLLRNIADEAAKRGADILTLDTKIQDANRSLAMRVHEITASLESSNAGVRSLEAAYANESSATATKVTQLQASLGRYYQDGRPGSASLEQEMTTQASYSNGLRAQYTLKVQAGGALAGYGIAAEEINGVPSSAFIIRADKFAIVAPNYMGGQTATPSNDLVPFGVDANGIYLNSNVYIRGNMRVDTSGQKLSDGLRGSLNINGGGGYWSDSAARQAIWSALGKSGTPTNSSFLVIGDSVTMGTGTSTITRYWTGDYWQSPGAVVNGDMLVNGSISASKLSADAISVNTLRSGTTYHNSGSFSLGVGTTLANRIGVAAFDSNSSNSFCLLARSLGGAHAIGAGALRGGDSAIIGVNSYYSSFSSFNTSGELGLSDGGGRFIHHGAKKQIDLATTTHAAYLTSGTVGPFTASHDGLYPKDAPTPVEGDIVVDCDLAVAKSVNDAITFMELSSTPMQKNAVGVFTVIQPSDFVPAAMACAEVDDTDPSKTQHTTAPHCDHLLQTHHVISFNAVGEGLINLCGEGGDIEPGDLITTSSMPGKGMKQNSDLVRNYTIAKARQRIVFSSPNEVRQAACIYMAG